MQYSRMDYTGLIEDMVDGFKTRRSYYHSGYQEYNYKAYQDSISGYTINQIEESLIGIKTLEEWKQNLKNLFENETEHKLDEAFNYWYNL
jgi:hypothetical protein